MKEGARSKDHGHLAVARSFKVIDPLIAFETIGVVTSKEAYKSIPIFTPNSVEKLGPKLMNI